MQAQEPCWFNIPPTCRDPNFVYAAGKGAGSAESNRNLAEAEAIRRYVAEVRGVQLPDATYKEIIEKGVENTKIEGIPIQYRVVRQIFENNNYYILLLLPRRFSTDPRSIIYPVEELCDPRVGIAKTAEPMKVGENISLRIASERYSDLEIVTPTDGNLTLSFETFAENTYIALFNTDGIALRPPKDGIISGRVNYARSGGYGEPINSFRAENVLWCQWNSTVERFKGSFTFKLDAGTYYLRIIRSQTGLSTVNLSTEFKAL
jgi:hypothetical protein